VDAAPAFGRLRVGTSGYDYGHWKGHFYPADLAGEERLAFYAGHFETVEINATFYGLPQPETFDRWRDVAPAGFVYSLKFSRYGSHLKHLKDPEETVSNFVERAERLRATLGPILVQLPPRWHADPDRLDAFLGAAPTRHRWAVEFRDPSWLCDEVFGVLRAHGAALCIHDLLPEHPLETTSDWTYIRFHGHVPGGEYGARRLMLAVRVIERFLGDGLDVYAYFNNDAEGRAIRDARELKRVLGDLGPAQRSIRERGLSTDPRS
jgi:uncharacterized protein YecE (DUF72 family)